MWSDISINMKKSFWLKHSILAILMNLIWWVWTYVERVKHLFQISVVHVKLSGKSQFGFLLKRGVEGKVVQQLERCDLQSENRKEWGWQKTWSTGNSGLLLTSCPYVEEFNSNPTIWLLWKCVTSKSILILGDLSGMQTHHKPLIPITGIPTCL